MDIIGGLIARSWKISPRLCVQLYYMRERWQGEPSFRALDRFVKSGDVVVDIGANWGLYTHRLARIVGHTGHVHAFEPEPTSLEALERVRGKRSNITVYPLALSDHAGEARLHVPLVGGNPIAAMASLSVPRGRAGVLHRFVTVGVDRLDAILPPGRVPITFIKCDVEGHELAVIRGAEATLRRSLPTLLIEIEQRHQDTDIRETFEYLTELGYVGYALHTEGLRPLREFDVDRDQRAFLDAGFVAGAPPREYVHDFVFVRRGT